MALFILQLRIPDHECIASCWLPNDMSLSLFLSRLEGRATSQKPRWKHSIDMREVAKEMTWICTTLIRLKEVRPAADQLHTKFRDVTGTELVVDKETHVESFLSYSAEHWPYHL